MSHNPEKLDKPQENVVLNSATDLELYLLREMIEKRRTAASVAAELWEANIEPTEQSEAPSIIPNTLPIAVTVPVKDRSHIELAPGMSIYYGWADRGQEIRVRLDGKTIEQWKQTALEKAADLAKFQADVSGLLGIVDIPDVAYRIKYLRVLERWVNANIDLSQYTFLEENGAVVMHKLY